MKWFKHFTSAHNDNALKKVRMKYGAEGYAVYWFCLELVAADLDQNKANFELNHDSEVIAYDLKMDRIKVQEIMEYMVSLRLFERANDVITCLKLAKFLDKKSTRSPEIHRIIEHFEQSCDSQKRVADNSGQVADLMPTVPNKSAPDKIRLDNKGIYLKSFEDFWSCYPRKVEKKKSLQRWLKIKPDSDLVREIISDVNRRIESGEWSESKYIPYPTTYLNGERWNDDPNEVGSSEAVIWS